MGVSDWIEVERSLKQYAAYTGEGRAGLMIKEQAEQLLRILPVLSRHPALAPLQPSLSHGALLLRQERTLVAEITWDAGHFHISPVDSDEIITAVPSELVGKLEKTVLLLLQ